MEDRRAFLSRVQEGLNKIDPAKLLYHENEFWLIQQAYEYVEYYAIQNQLYNTAVALPLMRGLHNGTYRKFAVTKDGESYRLPYYIHCLMVARMLVDIPLELSHEEKDILLASALCHDAIEDIDFKNKGKELVDEFSLDPRVYETVFLVSKRKDFTIEEEQQHFHKIEENLLALLIKLADRGNNVEDLYNMSSKKLKEYIEETRTYFVPMCSYGLSHYKSAESAIYLLKDKIFTLVNVSEIMISNFDEKMQQLKDQRDLLKLENIRLREQYLKVWNGGLLHE